MKYSDALQIMGPNDLKGEFRVQFLVRSKYGGLHEDAFPDPNEDSQPLTSLNEAWEAARKFASKAPWAEDITVVNAHTNDPIDPHRIYNRSALYTTTRSS